MSMQFLSLIVFIYACRRQYHGKMRSRVDSVLVDSVYETTETHVATFILSILHQGLFSVSSLIIAIIYLSRFKEVTKVSLHTYSWRLLFLTSLLVADKANEDKPIKNGSLVRLFPVVAAADLNELEQTMLLRIKFSIFIKSELFCSFLEKLDNESVSIEVNEIVNNSDLVVHQLLPTLHTLPCTPEPMMVHTTPKMVPKQYQPVSQSSHRSRSRQPTLFTNLMGTTPRRLMAQTVAPVVIEAPRMPQRGRSQSISRRDMSSSFMDQENSLDYSRSSSRRHSFGRPAHVPPPPIFEPSRPHGQARRLSVGRSGRDPMFEGAGAIQGFHAMAARAMSPKSNSFVRMVGHRPLSTGPGNRWNGLF